MASDTSLSLVSQTQNLLIEQKLLKKGHPVCIGVSGGADSVALFCILHELRHQWGTPLHIAHFDHQTGPNTRNDAAFVAQLAEKYHVPFHSKKWTQQKKILNDASFEQRARQARYAFFKTIYEKTKSQCLMLAHTRNDQAETAFMHMMKGGGLQGARGMDISRVIDDMHVVRPLLKVEKKTLLDHLKKKKQTFVTDPTNTDTRFTRNIVRRHIFPYLEKKLSLPIIRTLSRHADIMQVDYHFVISEAQKKFKKLAGIEKYKITFRKTSFLKSHPSIQRQLLRLAYKALTGSTRQLTHTHVEEAETKIRLEQSPFALNWPKNIQIYGKKDHFFIQLMKKA